MATYKIFTGDTLSDALNRARYEYGDWIELVEQKKKYEKKGFLGLFGRKEYVEILVDVHRPAARSKTGKKTGNEGRQGTMDSQEAIQQVKKLIDARKKLNLSENTDQGGSSLPGQDMHNNQAYGQNVMPEIKELKEMLGKVIGNSGGTAGMIKHSGFERIKSFLEDNDFEKNFNEEIVDTLRNTLTVKDIADSNQVRDKLEELLRDKIDVALPLSAEGGLPRVVALVGPTGVGKTTTIAKIGAGLTYHENCNVRLMSMDNYRIGGQQQLEQYAKIMDLPFNVIHQKSDITSVIEKNSDDEAIYILDTAGRSQKKELEVNEIRHFLQDVNIPLEVYLVLSATTKYRDLLEIMEKFEIMNYNKVILTKADETNSYGSIISALNNRNKKIAYICTGQDVPDDIKIAEKKDLVSRIMMRYPLYNEDSRAVL